MIPDILRAIEAGQPAQIRSPHAIRPWQHVLEPLSGYLTLAEKLYTEGPAYAEGWNFGPADTDARPVQWIVEQLTALWDEGASWQLDEHAHPHEAHYLKLDCSKARARLGWHPRWDLPTTLASIVRWHKQMLLGDNMQILSLQQIVDYQSQAHP